METPEPLQIIALLIACGMCYVCGYLHAKDNYDGR